MIGNALAEGRANQESANDILRRRGSAVEAEDLLVRFDDNLQNLRTLTDAFDAIDLQNQQMCNLQREMRRVYVRLNQDREKLREMLRAENDRYQAAIVRTGQPGRPKVEITRDQLLIFQQLGFPWTAMARMLGE